MGMMAEFKEFAMRGNAIDLAVGVVIGAAFGKIVTALVDNVIMPPIGLLIGGVDFSDWAWTLKEASVDAAGNPVAALAPKLIPKSQSKHYLRTPSLVWPLAAWTPSRAASSPSKDCCLIQLSMSARENRHVPPTLKAGIFLAPANL